MTIDSGITRRLEELAEQVRLLQVQQQEQQQQQQQRQLQEMLSGSFASAVGATPPVDPLTLALDGWTALTIGQRFGATRAGAKFARIELQRELPDDPRAAAPYVVVCGREGNGLPRIVHSGNTMLPPERVEALEQRYGCRAWRLAGPVRGVAEETGPDLGAPLAWAPVTGPVLAWTAAGGGPTALDDAGSDDYYPRVRIRISAVGAPDQTAEFKADLDTGAQFCAFPLHPTGAASLDDVLLGASLAELTYHLGQEWEVYIVDPSLLRLEVQTEEGWREFTPRNRDEAHELRFSPEWGPTHALCQVRPERQAFVGRPVWRGAVKLTLESTSADWTSAPPVTY